MKKPHNALICSRLRFIKARVRILRKWLNIMATNLFNWTDEEKLIVVPGHVFLTSVQKS